MSMALLPESVEQPDEKLLFQDVGAGYHQCWYPIALSETVSKGQVIGKELCDGRVVLYRGADGVARVMTPFCKHMGSDLSVGDVVDNDLRCAFHHWQYGGDGRCTKIPSGDRVPRAARLFTFPVIEELGIIWVFWGREPLYPLPAMPGMDEERFVHRSFEVPLCEPLRVKPWVFATNVFDFQHLREMHSIPIAEIDIVQKEWSMGWAIEWPHHAGGVLEWNLWMFGTNVAVSLGKRGDKATMHRVGATPLGQEGSKLFTTVTAERSGHAEEFLDQQQEMYTQVINEDVPVLNTIRFGETHLVASDRYLARYLRYARNYPKATMAELEASTIS